MKLTSALFFAVGLTMMSCAEKSDNDSENTESKSPSTKKEINHEDSLKMETLKSEINRELDHVKVLENMMIQSNNIGGIKLGMTRDEIESLGYGVEEGVHINKDDPTGLEEEEEALIVSDAIDERLHLTMADDKVAMVHVMSDMVQTEKTAYLDMSIEDFLSTYPNATLHYHFMGNRVWFDVPELANIEFRIDIDDILEIETIDYDGSKDETELDVTQANPKGQIFEISLR